MSLKVFWEQKIATALRQSRPEKTDKFLRVIVELSGDSTDEIISIINANNGRLCRGNNIRSALVAEVPFSTIQKLAKSKQVKKIWSDNQIRICRN